MKENNNMEVYHGRPSDTVGRLAKEIAVYDLLDDLHIEYLRVDHEALFTIEGCHGADGAGNGALQEYLSLQFSEDQILSSVNAG